MGEETFHTFVCHADLLRIVLEQFVGHTGKAVLLLEEDRYPHLGSHFHSRTAGITTDTYTHIGTEVAHNLAGLHHGAHEVNQHTDIAPWATTVKAPNRQTDNRITCLWHTLHLHASERSDEQNIAIGVSFAQGVGYTYGGEDMASCSATRDKVLHYGR